MRISFSTLSRQPMLKQFEQTDDSVGIFLAGHAYFNVMLWLSVGLLPGCFLSGEPATAPHGVGLLANQETNGLSCELQHYDKIRGHQPSQSVSAFLYVYSQQRLSGSNGKRWSPFSPSHLFSLPSPPPPRESTDISPLHPSNTVLITPMGGDGRKDRKY